MRPIIIAIVGASGSGKTTLSKYLQRKYGIPAIVSTTTRPRREGEVEGEDYFFVRSTRGIGREAMLTYTRFGKHEYFSLRRQLPESGYCTYVVDENGIRALKQTAGTEYDVFTVYISCRTENLPFRGVDAERIEPDGFEGDLRTGATHGIKPSGLEVETDSRVYPILYRRCCHCPIICISLSAPSRNSASVPLFPSTTSIRE